MEERSPAVVVGKGRERKMRGFVAACCAVAVLFRGVGSEVVSGESEDNTHGFQYLGKFVYEYARAFNQSGAEIDTQQMRMEVTLTLDDDGKIPVTHPPTNWVVLLYDDEEGQCSSVENCPAGCQKDAKAKTCSGTADAVKGFQPVMYAVKHGNKVPYMENGVIDKNKPAKQLLCEDLLNARSERFDVKWDAEGGYEYKASRFIHNRRRDRAFYAVLATNDCKPLSEGASWRIHFANGGASTHSPLAARSLQQQRPPAFPFAAWLIRAACARQQAELGGRSLARMSRGWSSCTLFSCSPTSCSAARRSTPGPSTSTLITFRGSSLLRSRRKRWPPFSSRFTISPSCGAGEKMT